MTPAGPQPASASNNDGAGLSAPASQQAVRNASTSLFCLRAVAATVINRSAHPLLTNFRFRSIGPASMGGRIDDLAVYEDDPRLIEASGVFYRKGANPRHIRAALSNTLLLRGQLGADDILFAAQDLCASTDLVSAVFAAATLAHDC